MTEIEIDHHLEKWALWRVSGQAAALVALGLPVDRVSLGPELGRACCSWLVTTPTLTMGEGCVPERVEFMRRGAITQLTGRYTQRLGAAFSREALLQAGVITKSGDPSLERAIDWLQWVHRGSLSHDQLYAAHDTAVDLAREVWPAVCALAARLWEDRMLSGAVIRETTAAALGVTVDQLPPILAMPPPDPAHCT